MNLLAVLPLAVVMVAGPQIISAVLIATSQHARRTSVASVAFVAGVALAITVGTMVAYWLTGLVETSARSEGQGTVGTVIDWLVIVLLVVMLVRVFRRAEEHHPAQVDGPAADRRCAAAVPAGPAAGSGHADRPDHHVHRGRLPGPPPRPLVAQPSLLAAHAAAGRAPAACPAAARSAGQVLLPRLRGWMNTNSWMVSEVVIVFFLVLTISGMGD